MSDRDTHDGSALALRDVTEAGRRARGNPEKWSDIGRQQRFLDALRDGYSIGKACEQAGWNYQAWRKWAAEAEAADAAGERCKYSDLHDAYREAKRDGEAALYKCVQSAAQAGDWRAATWILERRESGTWAKSETVELTGKDGGPVQVDARAAVIDAARELADAALGLAEAPSDERDG